MISSLPPPPDLALCSLRRLARLRYVLKTSGKRGGCGGGRNGVESRGQKRCDVLFDVLFAARQVCFSSSGCDARCPVQNHLRVLRSDPAGSSYRLLLRCGTVFVIVWKVGNPVSIERRVELTAQLFPQTAIFPRPLLSVQSKRDRHAECKIKQYESDVADVAPLFCGGT